MNRIRENKAYLILGGMILAIALVAIGNWPTSSTHEYAKFAGQDIVITSTNHIEELFDFSLPDSVEDSQIEAYGGYAYMGEISREYIIELSSQQAIEFESTELIQDIKWKKIECVDHDDVYTYQALRKEYNIPRCNYEYKIILSEDGSSKKTNYNPENHLLFMTYEVY